MNCPECDGDTKALDSRMTNYKLESSLSTVETQARRRRLECLKCGHRFTTYELKDSSLKLLKETDNE